MDEATETHGDACRCVDCKRARKAAYMRQYLRDRKARDSDFKASETARSVEGLRRRMAADPEYAAHIRERDRKRMATKRASDPEAARAYNAQWQTENRDKVNAKARRYRERHPEHRERANAARRAKRANATPEELEATHVKDHAHYRRYKATYNANAKAWRERNKERTRAYQVIKNANRRARERTAGGTWTWEQFKDLCFLTGNHCYYCGDVPKKLTPDHAIPLARGGTNDITNIVPACLPCNVSKYTMTSDEFIARLMEES